MTSQSLGMNLKNPPEQHQIFIQIFQDGKKSKFSLSGPLGLANKSPVIISSPWRCSRGRISASDIEPINTALNLQYRYFTRKKATSYGVTGWVRNAPNNKVEGEAQGEDDVMQKFMKDVERGPSHSAVEKVEKQEIEVVDGETEFEVRS
ncbi:Acylphosphatase-domain-containing protein [Cadophora sp. MPI-SDFR-AT-0126]|nr:Acylphosphatase-domain-containing protein [Leotiomycetes sp. MPI-SDFR-AT-0126]